ncbi:FYVE, RhoGEF and PH domain-containing protein 2-like [Lytechinus pictus]|uniref:FYVE, RhoGEF and PH domain-containing protein 2-like n=1 Tax=Lytechinus pictus TaxID=7653 RepID=UPI0030B9B622
MAIACVLCLYFPLSCYACIFKDTISLHGDELDDVFWDEKSEFGFLDDNDEEEDRDEEDGEIQEYHSESNLLHETTYIKNGHHHHHYQQNHHHQHHHYHTTQIDHNHYNQRRPTSPSVIPLRQNRLLQGKCYKEYRLSRSMPNLADEGHLVLSISNAQGLFQKAQQKVRGGRRISSRRYRHSRKNKPPVPRKPTHLAQKLNNNKQGISSLGITSNTTTTSNITRAASPKVRPKAPLTAAKSTGASIETRRVNNLSQDQRTYDQVCFEDPATFSPQPKNKNLERFFGMKPEMSQPITRIKSIDPLSPTIVGGTGGTKGFMNKISKRKSDSGDDMNNSEHYAVVDLHDDRTTGKGSKGRRGGKNSAKSRLSPNKPDIQRNSSGQDTSKLSSDSGISMNIDHMRGSRGASLTGGFKDQLDKTGSIDSDYAEDGSTYSEDSAQDSDSEPSEEEFELKERPAESITFINQSHKVAYEVLTSERQYVDRLHLLHKVFEQKIRSENSKHNWFPKDVINVIFSNLSTIYEFHSNFVLTQLEDRMKEWEKNPCLGDILVRLSPFMKLYTDYVGNFDKAVERLNMWMVKVPSFQALVQDIQKKPICVNLTLRHHMLEPVQRIPRYELLLKEYLKKLPAESSDRPDAERALGLISTAAHHSNDMMQTMDHFAKLVKLNEKIDFNGETIIDPSRRLLKEGKITRVAARSGDLLDRYLFLFNDILLCCTQKRQITGSVSYKVKDKIDIDGVKLLDGNTCTTRFRLERSPKSLEFETNTDEQKEEWMAVLLEAIKEMVRKKDSFKTSTTLSEKDDDYAIPLGERPPSFVKDEDTTMCMKCGLEFSLTRRRHHCRACGVVVCGKCSKYTAPLPYDDKRPNKVCSKCYYALKGEEDPAGASRKSFVDIDENKSYASNLWYFQPKGSTWVRYWVAATEQDLFALRAPKDVRAVLTLPIKLYQAYEVEEKDRMERDNAFKLCEGGNSYIFAADNKETKYNWLLVFHEGLQKVLNSSASSNRSSSTNL